jgi:transcription elongation factor GreA
VNEIITLKEAADSFLAQLAPGQAVHQRELKRFIGWFGVDKPIGGVTPAQVGHYAESLSGTDTDYARKQDTIKRFLAYAKKEGWIAGNLGANLKARKEKTRTSGVTRTVKPEQTVLTRAGYETMQQELAGLKDKRPSVLDDIRRAAADKDFRENAPLHAAREQLGHIDGRAHELEGILKSANIIGDSQKEESKVALGNAVLLLDLSSNEKKRFTIVGPKEARPTSGKISHVSPIGRAILGKNRGDTVEVITPSGKRSYRIEEIGSGKTP